MPRKARLLIPNCPHHIVQRGHNRKAVFVTDDDYLYYLENLREWKKKLNVQVYAWCLMTNHIHLVVEPGDDAATLSQLMKRLAGRQAALVNKMERRTGSLWEGRFKASPIQRDSYLLACCRYVELNPVRARMVSEPMDYMWSSYRVRVQEDIDDWLDYDPCYLAIGRADFERRERYARFVQQGIEKSEQTLITAAIQRNQLTGDQCFAEEITQRTGLRIERRGRGRLRKAAPLSC